MTKEQSETLTLILHHAEMVVARVPNVSFYRGKIRVNFRNSEEDLEIFIHKEGHIEYTHTTRILDVFGDDINYTLDVISEMEWVTTTLER